MTTSASPSRRSASRQRREQGRVDHRPHRPVEGTDEVLPLREVDRGLAADRRVDLADERRRHRDPATPRRYVAATKPAASVVQPPPSATSVPAAVEPELAPEPLDASTRLRLLALRQLVRRGQPARRARPARRRRRSRRRARRLTSATWPSPGTSSPRRSSEPALDVDAAGREHDIVDVARARVGDLLVQRRRSSKSARKPPRPAPADGRRRRPARHAVSTSTSTRTVIARSRRALADLSGAERAAAERDHRRLAARAPRARPRLDLAERRLARARRSRGSCRRRAPRSRGRGRRTAGRAARATSAPSVVLPAPMKPTSATCRSSAVPVDPLQVGAVRRDEVAERVAAELLPRGAGELERDRRLGDDGERLDRGGVARSTSASAGSPVARSTDSQRLHQRRQRLHRRADDDLLAVRDAGLDPARAVRLAVEARRRSRRAPPSRAARRARSRRRSRRP